MKEQYLYRQAGEKKSKKRLSTPLLVICCNVLLLGFATTFGYSSPPPPDTLAVIEKTNSLSSPGVATGDLGKWEHEERAARIVHARRMEREKAEISLNAEQRKKLALLLLFAGGQARSHF